MSKAQASRERSQPERTKTREAAAVAARRRRLRRTQPSRIARQRRTLQTTNRRRPNHHYTKNNGPQLPNHNGRECDRDLWLQFLFYIYIYTHKRKSTRMVQRFQSVPHHATTSAGRRIGFVRSNGWWLRPWWVAFLVAVVVVWYQSDPSVFRTLLVANAFVIPMVPAAFHTTTRRIQPPFLPIPVNNNKATTRHHLQSRAREGKTRTRTALRRPNHDDDNDDSTVEESAQSSMPLLLPASSGLASYLERATDNGSAVSTTMATKPTNSSSSLFSSSSFLDFLFPPNYTSSTVSSSRNHNDNNDTHHILVSPSHVTLRKLQLQFTCNICGCRNCHAISRSAYQTGVVIVTCQNTTCAVQHLIADHLGFTNLVGSSSNRQNEEQEGRDSRNHHPPNNNNNKDDPHSHTVARAGGGNIEDFLLAKEDHHHDSAKTNLAGHDTTTTTHSPVQRVSRQVFELEQAFYNSTTDQDPSSCRNETPNQYE